MGKISCEKFYLFMIPHTIKLHSKAEEANKTKTRVLAHRHTGKHIITQNM